KTGEPLEKAATRRSSDLDCLCSKRRSRRTTQVHRRAPSGRPERGTALAGLGGSFSRADRGRDASVSRERQGTLATSEGEGSSRSREGGFSMELSEAVASAYPGVDPSDSVKADVLAAIEAKSNRARRMRRFRRSVTLTALLLALVVALIGIAPNAYAR